MTSTGVMLASYRYTYRADGLKIGETDVTLNGDGTTTTVTISWTYDALGRLLQEVSTATSGTPQNYTDNYTYDLNSNRLTETIDQNNVGSTTDTITNTYNANNELTQAVDANTGTTVYAYDANGAQVSLTHTPNGSSTPDTTTTNEYDLQGQLAGSQTVTSAGTATATYEYDDQGNRLQETATAAGSTTPVTTNYLVDVNNPTGYAQTIEEVGTVSFAQVTYIWGLQLIGETYADGATIPGVGVAQAQTTYYVLQDAHGSTRLITDTTGAVVAQYNYDAFGNALAFNPSAALTTYLYSSMPYDPAAGNYYDHARFYNTGTGEFTQADTYTGQLNNPMSYLPYAYGGGDPVNMVDASGHDAYPYSGTNGIAAHVLFSAWAVTKGLTPTPGAALNYLFPDAAALVGVKLAPDVVDLSNKTYYDLKSITHLGSPLQQAKDAAKMALYQAALGPLGYGPGNQETLVPSATPIGYILGDQGEVLLETLYPQENPMEPSNLPGQGLILYSLTRVSPPEGFPVPVVVPAPSQRPVRLLPVGYSLNIPIEVYYGAATVLSLGLATAAAYSGVGLVAAQNFIAPVVNTAIAALTSLLDGIALA